MQIHARLFSPQVLAQTTALDDEPVEDKPYTPTELVTWERDLLRLNGEEESYHMPLNTMYPSNAMTVSSGWAVAFTAKTNSILVSIESVAPHQVLAHAGALTVVPRIVKLNQADYLQLTHLIFKSAAGLS